IWSNIFIKTHSLRISKGVPVSISLGKSFKIFVKIYKLFLELDIKLFPNRGYIGSSYSYKILISEDPNFNGFDKVN
ncbi:MAG: hypothetical protein CSA15_11215, partial [Candidatus Delongbacteria bacterium]